LRFEDEAEQRYEGQCRILVRPGDDRREFDKLSAALASAAFAIAKAVSHSPALANRSQRGLPDRNCGGLM
jgi:hypothetical protein